jgi:hypothetical protein
MRNAVKRAMQLAGMNVVRPDVTGRSRQDLAEREPDGEQIGLHDSGWLGAQWFRQGFFGAAFITA